MTEETKTTNTNSMSLPQKQEEEMTIDLLELFFAMVKHWWIILISVAVLGLILGGYCHFLVSDSYQADASLYITANTGTDSSNVSYSNLQTSAALTNDYENIIKSRYVLMQVIENLGLSVDYDQLYDMVTVTNPEETHIIQISVTCEIPDDAIIIANEVMNVSADEIYKIIGGSEPTVVSEAMYAEDVKPSTLKYAAIGALLGLVLSCGVIAVRVILDTTIKTEEDIANYLELPVLASIPKNGGKKSGYGYGYGAERNAGGNRA